MIKTPENQDEIEKIAPFTKEYKLEGKLPAYYLCENYSCKAPVHSVEELSVSFLNCNNLVDI